MRNRFAWSCCAVLVLGSSPPPAHEAPDLRAIKPWDLDYGEAQCTAMREYGDAADPVTLAIIPAFDGSSYRLVVAYKRRSPDAPDEFLGKIDFGSGPISAWAMKYGTEDRKLTLYQYRVDAAEMALARTAQRLTLHLRGAPDATFSLENTPELLDGLQKCTADLQDFWNFGGERNGRIAVPSKGNIRYDFYPSDYPWIALNRRQEGTSQYMLLIDENGKVAGCDVLKPSGVPALDVMGCLVIKERSSLTPAKDTTGKPVRSTFVTPNVVWRLAY